jgi:quinol monooxygenase YgiN
MKKILPGLFIILLFASCTGKNGKNTTAADCLYNRDSMVVVMRFERKVQPQYVSFLKKSFDECREQVLAKEPGCLDYSLFQSYHDSTFFCLTETWATKGAHNAHMQLEHTKKHISETKNIADTSFKSTTGYTYWICPGANRKQ